MLICDELGRFLLGKVEQRWEYLTENVASALHVFYPYVMTASNVLGRQCSEQAKEDRYGTHDTSEIVVAYTQYPRKAYLLLFSLDKGEPHEYEGILDEKARMNRIAYLTKLKQERPRIRAYDGEAIAHGSDVLVGGNAHSAWFGGTLRRADAHILQHALWATQSTMKLAYGGSF